MLRKFFYPLVYICAVFLISACSSTSGDDNPFIQDTYQVDSLFIHYYERLGGRDVLGPAISPLYYQNQISYQYTITCLMMYNQATKKYQLAALGREMVVAEALKPRIGEDTIPYSNGHFIYPAFEALIKNLGGFDIVGYPLTEVRYNEIEHRLEQYFENVGFYQMDDDPNGEVYLLAYGSWKCGVNCSQIPTANNRIDLPIKKAAPFVTFVTNIGADFSGFALTEPFFAPDGNLQQIFENLVLAINPEHPEIVTLLPLPELSGYKPDPLERPSSDPNFYFFQVETNTGYNVPVQFMDYIKSRGGIKIVGRPIMRAKTVGEDLLAQCFKMICLQQKRDVYGMLTITPLPLGVEYRDKVYAVQVKPISRDIYSEISIQLWERYPMISPHKKQEIGAGVYAGNDPLPNVELELIVTLPNGREKVFNMPPTRENGETQLLLDPIAAEKGTLIPYQVCVISPNQQRFCVKESYLIWEGSEPNEVNPNYLPVIYR
jgi:hypothetical protein